MVLLTILLASRTPSTAAFPSGCTLERWLVALLSHTQLLHTGPSMAPPPGTRSKASASARMKPLSSRMFMNSRESFMSKFTA
eukprot:15470932-Alexandrium_andersonii.AAC.1